MTDNKVTLRAILREASYTVQRHFHNGESVTTGSSTWSEGKIANIESKILSLIKSRIEPLDKTKVADLASKVYGKYADTAFFVRAISQATVDKIKEMLDG